MFCRPAQLGIKEISKEEYLAMCDKGLELFYVATCDGASPTTATSEDVLMVSMCRPGETESVVSYVRLRNAYVFTKGEPWSITPLRAYVTGT